jgi:transcriptional regulator with XRE-family HTH domain
MFKPKKFVITNKQEFFSQSQTIAQMQVLGCEISRETYAKIESGIANVRAGELVALAKIFKTDMNAFFEGIE